MPFVPADALRRVSAAPPHGKYGPETGLPLFPTESPAAVLMQSVARSTYDAVLHWSKAGS